MRYWTNVCIEGHCLADGDDCPCGRHVPSPFCLGNGKTGHCPHFGWTDTTERDAAKFVPIRLILKDKVIIWATNIRDRLEWIFWGQLWFNRRKIDEFFKNIKVATPENCPTVAKLEAEQKKNEEKFKKWFAKARKEW